MTNAEILEVLDYTNDCIKDELGPFFNVVTKNGNTYVVDNNSVCEFAADPDTHNLTIYGKGYVTFVSIAEIESIKVNHK